MRKIVYFNEDTSDWEEVTIDEKLKTELITFLRLGSSGFVTIDPDDQAVPVIKAFANVKALGAKFLLDVIDRDGVVHLDLIE